MRILITGSKGFIGKHLVRSIKLGGDEVVELDRGDKLPDNKGINHVYHLASNVPFAEYNYNITHVIEDALTTLNVITYCNRNKVDCLVFPSGKMVTNSNSLYAVSKRIGEWSIRKFCKVKYIIIRLPAIFGQGQREVGRMYSLTMLPITNENMDYLSPLYMPIEEATKLLLSLPYEINVNTVCDGITVSDMKTALVEFKEAIKKTIYFDFDGTLVNLEKREPYKGRFKEIWKNVKNDKLFPGVKKILSRLKKAGYRLILITKRSNRKLFMKQVKLFKIEKYFDEIINTSDRPKHEFIKYYHNAMIVGDTEADIEAGQIMGIDTVAVSCGMRTYIQLMYSNPTHIYKNLKEAFWE